jgi:hypothetical protein
LLRFSLEWALDGERRNDQYRLSPCVPPHSPFGIPQRAISDQIAISRTIQPNPCSALHPLYRAVVDRCFLDPSGDLDLPRFIAAMKVTDVGEERL